MAKYSGNLGFAVTQETAPSVFKPVIVERHYTGDMPRNIHKVESSSNENDNINVNNQISILMDTFLADNFSHIKYVTLLGARWKVKTATIDYPRVVLEIGGVWNGQKPS